MTKIWFPAVLSLGLMVGCASSPPKSVEVLDERTGVTLGVLKEPIELVPSALNAAFPGARASFAYIGPVEWNRTGTLSYSLWIHIAPGNDRQIGDIHAPSAVTLILDASPLTLSPSATARIGRDAYQAVASWGQTAYFDLSVETLKKIAASQKFELDVGAADGTTMRFSAAHDTRAILLEYLHSRGLTDD